MNKERKAIVFATNNKHKLAEINAIAGSQFHVISLEEAGFTGEIPETAPTIEGNALMKARYIFERVGTDCFADDTGLEVESLNGAPGVYSARYAGEHATYQDNVLKLLDALHGQTHRTARFRTVIVLIFDTKEFLFEGIVEGKIIEQPLGQGGFGYDPVFVPDGYEKTFAELAPEEKNSISHRGKAMQKLLDFLKSV
ncbi:MAG: non-canonical purine NTP diphosphatase [Bacteroidales bacterium]|nr:non-canonical purine NTP diphosphatase [Bacteroidales bacterium]